MDPVTSEFDCSRCHKHIVHTDTLTTGYGTNAKGEKVCFACCGETDREFMDKTGKTVLYLSTYSDGVWNGQHKVTNWPGTLEYRVYRAKKSFHNIAGERTDFWFHDHKGYAWHGFTVGHYTQSAYVKRLKIKK